MMGTLKNESAFVSVEFYLCDLQYRYILSALHSLIYNFFFYQWVPAFYEGKRNALDNNLLQVLKISELEKEVEEGKEREAVEGADTRAAQRELRRLQVEFPLKSEIL
jgi:hypothetical protein